MCDVALSDSNYTLTQGLFGPWQHDIPSAPPHVQHTLHELHVHDSTLTAGGNAERPEEKSERMVAAWGGCESRHGWVRGGGGRGSGSLMRSGVGFNSCRWKTTCFIPGKQEVRLEEGVKRKPWSADERAWWRLPMQAPSGVEQWDLMCPASFPIACQYYAPCQTFLPDIFSDGPDFYPFIPRLMTFPNQAIAISPYPCFVECQFSRKYGPLLFFVCGRHFIADFHLSAL